MPDSLRNWETSLPGLLVLLIVIILLIVHPEMIKDPVILGLVALAVGLLRAKDANKSGTSALPPKE